MTMMAAAAAAAASSSSSSSFSSSSSSHTRQSERRSSTTTTTTTTTRSPLLHNTKNSTFMLLFCCLGLLLLASFPVASAFVIPPPPSSLSSSSPSSSSPLQPRPSTAAAVGAGASLTSISPSHHHHPQLKRRQRFARLDPLRIVWSNPQETEDYIRHIEGKEEKDKADQPSVIIGKGRLAQALAEWGGSGYDVLVGRGEEIPTTIKVPKEEGANGEKDETDSFPIYVCVPEWEVEDVIVACPKEKRNDLVFMQTACMENLLKRYGCCTKKMTQCTPYFTVSPIGRAIDGRVQYDVSKMDGEPKYAGQTTVCGKWRGAVVERLQKQDLSVLMLDYTRWRKHMLERLVFDAIFGLVALVHGNDKTYGELAQNHWEELDDMIIEVTRGMQNTMAVVILSHAERRMRGIAEGARWKDMKPRMATQREYPFRNGVFRSLSRMFTTRGFPSPTPTHDEYLEFAQERKLIDYEINLD